MFEARSTCPCLDDMPKRKNRTIKDDSLAEMLEEARVNLTLSIKRLTLARLSGSREDIISARTKRINDEMLYLEIVERMKELLLKDMGKSINGRTGEMA